MHLTTGTPVLPGATIAVWVREDELEEIGYRRLHIYAAETAENRSDANRTSGLSRYLALRPEWDLERALRTDWARDDPRLATTARIERLDGDASSLGEDGMERILDKGLMFIRMVVNAILYISARHADLVDRRDGEGEHTPPLASSPRQFTSVGESIGPLVTVMDKSADVRTEGGLPTKRRLKVRYLQAGFWRRPPSTADDHPKTIFVQPHYRGPEAADVLHRPVLVR